MIFLHQLPVYWDQEEQHRLYWLNQIESKGAWEESGYQFSGIIIYDQNKKIGLTQLLIPLLKPLVKHHHSHHQE